MTVAELAAGAETLLTEVRRLAALRKERDANRALLGARERAVNYPPSGCAWCGRRGRNHEGRWDDTFGWHSYWPPTTDQIKTRMLARRYNRAADAQNTNTEK